MIRKARKADLNRIIKLYKKASTVADGIARTKKEINKKYVCDFLLSSLNDGIIFVIENPKDSKQLIAEIHCYKIGPKCFDHTLSNLTLAVDPEFHGQGIGFKIFSALLDEIKNNHPDIARVELPARESNKRARNLYEKLGFEIEGIMKNRIMNSSDKLEDDLMFSWLNPNYKYD